MPDYTDTFVDGENSWIWLILYIVQEFKVVCFFPVSYLSIIFTGFS